MTEKDWTEARTRKEYIDKLLIEAGWGPIVPHADGKTYVHGSVEEHPTESGPADYVLFNDKRAVAEVEGKKVAVGPQNVLQQAERYAKDFQDGRFRFNEYKLPFAYSTNGKIIWFRDLRHPLNRCREIARIHTPAALKS